MSVPLVLCNHTGSAAPHVHNRVHVRTRKRLAQRTSHPKRMQRKVVRGARGPKVGLQRCRYLGWEHGQLPPLTEMTWGNKCPLDKSQPWSATGSRYTPIARSGHVGGLAGSPNTTLASFDTRVVFPKLEVLGTKGVRQTRLPAAWCKIPTRTTQYRG